jgi:hypothetical protein
MNTTTISRNQVTNSSTRASAGNAFAQMLHREHDRTQRFLGDARLAHAQLAASTDGFAVATHTLSELLAAFRLP